MKSGAACSTWSTRRAVRGVRGKSPDSNFTAKTGSAQVGSGANRILTTWFISFVTYRGKTYACCVMVEGGSSGGASCAPLAAEFFRRYLLEKP